MKGRQNQIQIFELFQKKILNLKSCFPNIARSDHIFLFYLATFVIIAETFGRILKLEIRLIYGMLPEYLQHSVATDSGQTLGAGLH